MNARATAAEAYRLSRDRGITPDEVFTDVLITEGYDPRFQRWNRLYRRAWRELADAYVAYAWDQMYAEGRLCGHCRQVMPPGRTGFCSASCERRGATERRAA